MPIRLKRGRTHWLVVAATLTVTLGVGAASELGLTANADIKPPAVTAASAAATPTHGAPSASAGKASASAKATTSASAKASGPAPGTHPMKFGVDYGSTLMTETPSQIRTSLQDAVSAGAKWIRVDLPWEAVQPTSPWSYNWSRFDVVADAARSLGLNVDAILDATAYWDTTPACKRGTPATTFCPPASNDDFARFATAAVQRYKNRAVRAWEIWNEPNISARWWPSPNAADYAQMLDTVARAIRTADHGAFTVMGGLAAVPDSPKQGYVSQNTYLNSLVGIKGSLADVNAVSYHPFSAPTLPSKAGDYSDVSSSPGNLLSILQTSGNPNVQIWITESGDTEYDGALEPPGTAATAAQLQGQADYATDLVKTVSGNASVAADFWFADQDIPSQNLYWGLRDAAGKARPVSGALKSAIAACGCSVS